MEKNSIHRAGSALIAGSVLMVVTMVLHPVGGSFAHLLKASPMVIGAHSIALVSLPVILFGFWGLANYFRQERPLSILAFCFSLFGLFAGLCAAAVNGLALPFFIKRYKDAPQEFTDTLSPILKYNTALNHAFDSILIAAICLAILLWSTAIAKGKELPRWLGYYGWLLSASAIFLFLPGETLTTLYGFRLFVFGLVSWIVATGFCLRSRHPH